MLGASIHFNPDGKEIKRQSLLVLSDNTTHDSVAVFASYMQLQKWLRDQMPALKRTTVVSDGCGGRISYQHIQFLSTFQANLKIDFNYQLLWITKNILVVKATGFLGNMIS